MKPSRARLSNYPLLSLLAFVVLSAVSPETRAELRPTYLACLSVPLRPQPPVNCSGTWRVRHEPGAPIESFIGYVEQTPVPGTMPAYLTCRAVRPTPRSQPQCDGRWFISRTPVSQFDSFIGYVYTTQVPQSSPRYIACVLAYTPPRAPTECANRWFTTSDSSRAFSSFIGYVYVEPPLWRYGLSPKYYVGSVIYMPPGQGPSSITYGAGTTTGTTLSTTDSWSVASSFGIGIGANGSSGTISFGNTFGGQTTSSVDVQMTSSASRTYRGQASNAINHDYDQVVLYLGVQLNASVNWEGNVVWDVDFSQVANQGFALSGYPISIGCLRPGSSVPPVLCEATLNFLAANGITAADFPEILKAHPFADPGASPSPDPDRYVLIDSVNFLPDPTSSTYTYNLTNNHTTTNARTSSVSFNVGFSGSFPLLKNSHTLTYTQSSTTSNRTGSSGTSTFVLSLPSAPYSGPSTLFVYVDTIYKTFMFSFAQ
jgi:hypothetical protein